jgi:Domain of unknown function (DUF397)
MIQWRKSSHSMGNAQGECVEVSTNVAGTTLIRDSKDPSGPRLSLGPTALAAFLSNVRSGRHDL